MGGKLSTLIQVSSCFLYMYGCSGGGLRGSRLKGEGLKLRWTFLKSWVPKGGPGPVSREVTIGPIHF